MGQHVALWGNLSEDQKFVLARNEHRPYNLDAAHNV